jgi:hypothetical protein
MSKISKTRTYLEWLEFLQLPPRPDGQSRAHCALAALSIEVASFLFEEAALKDNISPRHIASCVRIQALLEVKFCDEAPSALRSQVEGYFRLLPEYDHKALPKVSEVMLEAHHYLQTGITLRLWDWPFLAAAEPTDSSLTFGSAMPQ